ncbi:carboxymuconolactone decarboxylase family protein [Deinococcus hohokamensis]|uniref:Carboxymuconolactone decarboxylase family protein n=1 Tax=Deinococcus hohokamensis TaxID=309883 RepID=A0ABV9I6F7_9DEIO
MTPRLPYTQLAPAVFQALVQLEKATHALGLDEGLTELVRIRASQLNGCGYCLDLHSTNALKQGLTPRQVMALGAWREAGDLFSRAERAVLRLTDAVTLLPQQGVPDDVLAEMRLYWTDTQIVQWTLAIITINAWNRMGVTAGLHPTA